MTKEELLQDRRARAFVRPRMMAVWLARRITRRSYPDIARHLRRDHTTVLVLCRRFEAIMDKEPALRAEMTEFERLLSREVGAPEISRDGLASIAIALALGNSPPLVVEVEKRDAA